MFDKNPLTLTAGADVKGKKKKNKASMLCGEAGLRFSSVFVFLKHHTNIIPRLAFFCVSSLTIKKLKIFYSARLLFLLLQ